MFNKSSDISNVVSTSVFLGSLVIIVVFLLYISFINKDKQLNCVIPNEIVDNYRNYSYDIKYTSNGRNIDLYIKRYNEKYLIEKNEAGEKNTYFIYYTDIMEKASDGRYILFRKDNIIDGLDNKLLLLDYVNALSLKSSVSNDNELTCYVNRTLNINMCINLDDSITLTSSDYNIIYSVKEIGTIKDFSVDINIESNV